VIVPFVLYGRKQGGEGFAWQKRNKGGEGFAWQKRNKENRAGRKEWEKIRGTQEQLCKRRKKLQGNMEGTKDKEITKK